MTRSATTRATLFALFAVALFVTLVDAVKPLHIDDPFIYRIAEQIERTPGDPYGFDIFWLQWPQPVVEELTPPLLPYWWSIALAVAPDATYVWKLWLFPFALLLCGALYALGRRFAPGLELPFVLLVTLSPAFLPALNLMQDVPALALGLTALALFLHATAPRPAAAPSLSLAALAGLVAGLATQTKYTAVAALGAMALWGVLRRTRLPAAALAIAVALAVFFGWEALLDARYGHSMFFGQVRHGLYWVARQGMVVPLLRLLGATLPGVLLLALAGLGLSRRWLPALAVLLVGSVALLAVAPLGGPLFLVLGAAVVTTLAAVVGQGLRSEQHRAVLGSLDLFLAGWLLVELAIYFLAAPFPAVRRVMGLVVVAALLAARAAARRSEVDWRWPVAAGTVLGLLVSVVDQREATAQRDAVARTLDVVRGQTGPQDPEPTVWFLGHWGFQFYAERAGMLPVVPDVSVLRQGHWLVVPEPLHRQDVVLSRTDVLAVTRLAADRMPPLTTARGYYGSGDRALAHLATPRLTTTVYRVRRDTVLPSSWSPGQLTAWAGMAGGRTAAAALPALVRALEQASSAGRVQAAEGLGHLGPRGAPAAAALRKARADPDPDVRRAAAAALAAIGAE